MNIEIRVREYNELDKYLNLGFDVISIGDDGCVHKLPGKGEIKALAEKIIESGAKLKLVTPKIPETYFEQVIDTIESLSNFTKDYTLVVNDFGLLEGIQEREIAPKSILMGRSISRALEECAWYDELVKNEPEKLDIISNNFPDSMKIKWLSKYGVNGIEGSLLPNAHYAFSWIKKAGWSVSAHLGSVTLAYSRNCQYAKYKKLKIRECQSSCKEKIHIEMAQACDSVDFIPAIDKTGNRCLEFFLLGNIVCRDNKKDIEQFDLSGIDNIVVNTTDYNLEELKAIIKKGVGDNDK